MEIGYVKKQEIVKEMNEAYLDYAMSVIVSRALPDVRDGLKPVHRRILFAMSELGLRSTAKTRKSATVVGEVLGKYHPHGDSAVYDAMVRLAQDFSMRYPLVKGQGNFGSLDGDSAAAMRYTEARLTPLAEEMLQDLEKDTVDWQDNYDGTRKEPKVLPGKVPQLLLNGSVGIAVGMATSIPPHNLNEVADAIIHLIDNPKSASEDLMEFIKGPDFPTGGIIYDRKSIIQTYSTGKGPVVLRGKAEVVEAKKSSQGGRSNYQIIISEIPYQVNKATLLEHIAELVKDKKLDGIRDVRDETDRTSTKNGLVGVRIVVDVKPDTAPQRVLNRLFKMTELQHTFHFNLLSLADGIQPQVMSIKNILEHHIAHRKVVVRRRTEFELAKAKARAHILEGLKKALDHIDAIISVIKKSPTKEEAHANLMKKFKLSDLQSAAILEMRLQSLAGLEKKKIEDELKEKKRMIAEFEAILADAKKILKIIKEELNYLKEKFGDNRLTKVVSGPLGEINEEDLVTLEECVITTTQGGYIKRLNPNIYKGQKRGGKGISGITTKEEDLVDNFICASTHDELLFFTNIGRVFKTKAFEIPESSRTAKGQAMVNFLELQTNEVVSAILPAGKKTVKPGQFSTHFLLMATKNGIIKKTPIEDFANIRRSGLIAMKMQKGDELKFARPTSGTDEIIMVTADGQSIRFHEKDVRPMSRSASGVHAMRIKKNDHIIEMDVIHKELPTDKLQVLTIGENGYGKRTDLNKFKVQRRSGSGIKASQVTTKTGKVITAKILTGQEEELIAISRQGQVIKTALSSIPSLGRMTQGVRVMRLDAGDKVAQAAII